MAKINPENVMRRTRGENASYVIGEMRALGMNPNRNSRLMQMHRILNSGYIPFDHSEFPIALEAERDMQQLGFIFDQKGADRDNPTFMKLAADLMMDPALPQDNLERSPGRDAQFELYLAAICRNAGLLPVQHAEPDVSRVANNIVFSIAAKRIKSAKRVKDHVEKAADQIEKSKNPGVIALELSVAWNRKNLPIVSRLQSQSHVLIAKAQGDQFFDEHAMDIFRLVNGKGVLAVVAFAFRIRLRPDNQWGLDGMTTWLSTAEDDQGKQKYETIYRGFLAGIPNLTELDK